MAKKKLLVILLALFACFCLAMAGCSTNELTVTITNKESLTAEWSEGGPDRTIEFTVRRGGENVEGAEYTVSSDNSGVVSVDGTTLKAVSAGTATITVASGDASDSVQITVSLALKAVTITNKDALSATWHVGEADRTVELAFDPSSFNGENTDATLSSSDPTVISVNGMSLKAEKIGTAVITVTANGCTDSVTLSVRPTLDSLTITNKTEMEADWVAGTARTLALAFEPSDYFTSENTPVTVSSSPEDLISANGTELTLAGSVARGTEVTVTVTAEGVSDTFTFTAVRTAPVVNFSGVQPEDNYESTPEGGTVSVLEGTQVIMLPAVTATACDGSKIDESAITVTHSGGIDTDGFGTVYPAKGTHTVTYTVADPIDPSLTTSKTLTINVYRKVYPQITDWWMTTDGLFAEDAAQTASPKNNEYSLGVFNMEASKLYYAEVTFQGILPNASLIGLGHFEDGSRAPSFVNVLLISETVADNANSFRAADLGDHSTWTSITGNVVNYTRAQMEEMGVYPEDLSNVKIAVARNGNMFYCFIDDKFVAQVSSADIRDGYFGDKNTTPGIFGYNYAGVTVSGMQYYGGAQAEEKLQDLLDAIPVEVEITNKDALAALWTEGDADRTIEFTITRGGTAVEDPEYQITADKPDIIDIDGTTLKAVGAGTVTITVTCGDASDSVEITVGGVRTAPTLALSGAQPEDYFQVTEEGGTIGVLEGTKITLPTVTATDCENQPIADVQVAYSENFGTPAEGVITPPKGTHTVTYTAADPVESSLTTTKTLTINVYRKVYTEITDWWMTTDGLFAEDAAQTSTSLYPDGYALGVFNMEAGTQYYAEVTLQGILPNASLIGLGHFEDASRAPSFVNVLLISETVADSANSFRAADLGDNSTWVSITGNVVNYTRAQMEEMGVYPEDLSNVKIAVARNGNMFYCFIDDKFVAQVSSADIRDGYFGDKNTTPGIFGYNYAGVTVSGMQYYGGAQAEEKLQDLLDAIPVEVEITNKDALAALWTEGDADRTIEFTITRGGTAVEDPEYQITADKPDIIDIDGTTLKAVGAGTVTITVTCGDASDSVEITVGGVRTAPTLALSGAQPEDYFQVTEEGGTIGVLEGTKITLPTVTATDCENQPIADVQVAYSENFGTPEEGVITPPKGTHTVTYTVADPVESSLTTTKTLTVNIYRKVFADGAWMKTDGLFTEDAAQTASPSNSEFGLGVFNMEASKLYYAEVTFTGTGGLPGLGHFVNADQDHIFVNVFLTTGGDSSANSFRATEFGPASGGWSGIQGTIKNITRGELESQGLYPEDLTNVKFAVARNGNDFYCFVDDKLVAQMTCEYFNDKDTTPGVFGYNFANDKVTNMQYYGGTQAEEKIQALLQSA